MKQKTIRQEISLSGTGLHSGRKTTIKIMPAPDDSGILFIKQAKKIPATIAQLKNTKRGTSISGLAVTEHLLAAIYALGLDNLQIEVDGDELPAMDGSALPYVEALEQAGIVEQKTEKNIFILKRSLKITAGDASLEAAPSDSFKIDFMVDFPQAGPQSLGLVITPEIFKAELAPARTFGYVEEYELLKEQGLARGASLENALVLGKDGYINTPRFPDELVRHKILDLIGDLALLGRPLQAEIKASKSGHKLNSQLVRLLKKEAQ